MVGITTGIGASVRPTGTSLFPIANVDGPLSNTSGLGGTANTAAASAGVITITPTGPT